MKTLAIISRFLIGGIFLFSASMYFFGPVPEMGENPAADFFGAMAATGYFFPLLKITEVIAALLILSGRFTQIGLVILAPITLNILLFHVFVQPGGLFMGVAIGMLHGYLIYYYRAHFIPLFGRMLLSK
jgi:putative oxidoreductase